MRPLNILRYRSVTVICCAIALLSCFSLGFALNDPDLVKVTLGDRSFQIPKKYSNENSLPSWLRWIPGLDVSREWLLKFEADEVAEEVPDYRVQDGDYREDILAILAVLKAEEIKRYAAQLQLVDLWRETGSYTDRMVRYDQATDLYRVYRKVEYPYSWAVLDKDPSAIRSVEELKNAWVAQCLRLGSPGGESGVRVSCSSHAYFDNIVIDFKISGENIGVIAEVSAFLRAKVIAWSNP